jgi:hypothetical protein
MLIRFTVGTAQYQERQQYDLDTTIALRYIAQGVAVAVSTATTDKSATPGNVTINAPLGRAALAAAAATCVVTNSFVKPTSVVVVQLETNDGTATRLIVTVAAGSFTVTAPAAATGTTKFSFTVDNP